MGSRVPSAFPVMSTANHFHQSVYLTSNASGDLVFVVNSGSYRDPNNLSALSQIFRGFTQSTVIADFTLGFPITNPATTTVNCPLNTVNFSEDCRLVSQSLVFTYTGSLLNASGSLNATWFQYSLASNSTI